MARVRVTEEVALVEGGDARIEEYLKGKGVAWTFQAKVPTDSFDADASLREQVRFDTFDADVVEQYAEAMKRGDKFPPVIAFKGKADRYVNADGNHRLVAAGKAHKTLDVYDITGASPLVIDLIAAEINTRHGKPTSEAERIAQALHLMELGANIKVASATVNLPERVVRKASEKRATDQRFTDVGIPALTIEKLAESVKWRLSQISTDEGFEAAVRLVDQAGLSSNQVFDLVTRVNSVRSSDGQVRMLADMRVDYLGDIQQSGGGVLTGQNNGKRLVGPRTRIGGALSNLQAIPDVAMAAQLYRGAEREEVAKRAREAAKKLTELAKALSAP